MLGLLTRTPRRTSPARRSFRPCLERLETRFCPSSLTMNYTYGNQNNVTFSGQLTGAPNDAGQTIMIGGYGNSTTTTTDANGNYSVTVPVTQLGTVTGAYMVNGQPQTTASAAVNPAAPQITGFKAVEEPNDYYEFTGTVTGVPNPGGMTITLQGLSSVQGQTITVNANGTFSESFFMNGQTGEVGAMTMDWWGRNAEAGCGVI
jgi:hypothetical protein